MDPFSVFGRLGQRRGKSKTSSFNHNVEISGQDYLYIPSEAFHHITQHERYEHLNAGLYVGLDLLEINDENRDTLDEIVCFIDEDREGMLDDISWWEAKVAVQAMNGRMLTIPEYASIYDYLKTHDHNDILERMNPDNIEEWLDTRLTNEDVLMQGIIVDDGKTWDVLKEKWDHKPIIKWKGHFYYEHLDTLTGLPEHDPTDIRYTFTWYDENKDFYFDLVGDRSGMQVIRAERKNQEGRKIVEFSSVAPGYRQLKHGVRLCFDKSTYNNLFGGDKSE